MKKKILSTLLAVCLFVGIAIPAVFAGFDTSSQSGTNDQITSLKFDAASYEVKKNESKDMKDKILAFVGKNAIVQDANITYSIEDNTDLAFVVNGTEVTAIEEKGSATLVAKANDDKIVTKVKLFAKPESNVKATGFKFEKTTYNVPVNKTETAVATDFSVKAIPTPDKSKFTDAQVKALEAFSLKYTDDAVSAKGSKDGDGNIVYKFAGADLKDLNKDADAVKSYKFETTVSFPKPNDDDKTTEMKKAITFKAATPKLPTAIGAAVGTVDIEVGQVIDLDKYFKVGPSNANINTGYTLANDYANDKAEYDDYAVRNTENKKVMGVAVGKTKIVATLDQTTFGNKEADKNGKSISTSLIINVKPAGSIVTTPAGKISAEKAELAVGKTLAVSVKDVAKDAKITWKVSDSKVAQIAPFTGEKTTVYAKTAGTVKVTAMVNGVEVGTCTVTVKAADAVKPDAGKPSTNPQTGDSLFANLF